MSRTPHPCGQIQTVLHQGHGSLRAWPHGGELRGAHERDLSVRGAIRLCSIPVTSMSAGPSSRLATRSQISRAVKLAMASNLAFRGSERTGRETG